MTTRLKEEIKKMRFKEVYDDFKGSRLSCSEASRILGISERSFFRMRLRYESEDFDGCFDRRLSRRSNNRAQEEEVEDLCKMYEERYSGFSIRHFYEYYQKSRSERVSTGEKKKVRSYNWCRDHLDSKGILKKGKRRGGSHRQRRERKPTAGMMLHQDGSTHLWIEALGYNVDLIVTMDDATSEITSCFIVEQEGTMSSLQGIQETIESKGLFCTFYTDRGSHYAYTPEAGGKVDKSRLTEVGRALKELSIKHILAYSPEARGRSERMFGTLQGRLPNEFRLHGIKTIEEANKFLKDTYILKHNETFSQEATDKKAAYIPWIRKEALSEILCIKADRVVQKDNTVRYDNKILQIPPQKHRHHYVKSDVEVREYHDKSLAVFYGHMCLGRYDQNGNSVDFTQNQQEVA